MNRIGLALALFYFSFGHNAWAQDRPNVLFIAIDDMNDWTGFLGGHPQAKTPNLDQLAKRGVNFSNAHCVAPACSPSRLGLLYGIQPFRSGLYPFYDHAKIKTGVLDRYTSLPRLFRESGYDTFGAGKLFHGGIHSDEDWDDYLRIKKSKLTYAREKGYQIGTSSKMAFCPTTNPLTEHPDYQVASYGIDVINQNHSDPFFLAVGIVKPHLAFVCPESFFDQQAAKIEPPTIRHRDLEDVPWVARSMAHLSDDLKFRSDDAWEQVQRSYLACITWADYNTGRVLDALAASDHADNTIVVVWSDHGYHLSEKRSFRKFSLWEESTRVPLIIYDPRLHKGMQPASCGEAVSLIDLYPTLADLCDINAPKYVDGQSLQGQLKNPQTPTARPAITTWGRGNYSLRDKRFRYTRYFDGGEELYDHDSDPNEWNNLASSEAHEEVKKRFIQSLPRDAAPLVRQGIGLWNVIDADRPNKLEAFKQKIWPDMVEKLRPPISCITNSTDSSR